MSYNFVNKNDLEVLSIKNIADAKGANLAKDFDKKLKFWLE